MLPRVTPLPIGPLLLREVLVPTILAAPTPRLADRACLVEGRPAAHTRSLGAARRRMGQRSGDGGRVKRTPSPEWLAFLPHLLHPDQIAYEEIRPVVALHQEIQARAAE